MANNNARLRQLTELVYNPDQLRRRYRRPAGSEGGGDEGGGGGGIGFRPLQTGDSPVAVGGAAPAAQIAPRQQSAAGQRQQRQPETGTGFPDGSSQGVRRSEIASKDISPEGRALLDTIAGTESPGYNIIYGNRKFDSYADHPRRGYPITSGPNVGKTSSAAGRYQFLPGTWDPIAKELGLKDFSPESQDKAAWHLAKNTYAQKNPGRDLQIDLANKQYDRVGPSLRSQWTSLPGGIEQGVNANNFIKNYSRHYANHSPNPAQTPTTQNPTQTATSQQPATGGAGGSLSYTNQSAARHYKVNPGLEANITAAATAVYGPNARVEIYSGGQDEHGRAKLRAAGTHTSHRHNIGKDQLGQAADVHIYVDNKQITGDALNPLGQYWAAKKHGGVGMTMKGGGVHLDNHTNLARSWNYGGGESPATKAAVAAGIRGEMPKLYQPTTTQPPTQMAAAAPTVPAPAAPVVPPPTQAATPLPLPIKPPPQQVAAITPPPVVPPTPPVVPPTPTPVPVQKVPTTAAPLPPVDRVAAKSLPPEAPATRDTGSNSFKSASLQLDKPRTLESYQRVAIQLLRPSK